MDSGKDDVLSLLSLINSASKAAMVEYERNGAPVPSLDSVVAHPLDSMEDTAKLREAIRVLQGACHQLCSTLSPPASSVITSAQNLDWLALNIVTRAKVADELSGHPNGIHVDDISKSVGIAPGKLGRLLRLLATKHVFKEVSKDVFANNRLSTVLESSNSTSSFIYCTTTFTQKIAMTMYKTLTDPKTAFSDDAKASAFMQSGKGDGVEGTFYDWLQANPDFGKEFGRGMGGLSQGNLAILNQFPWDTVKTVCDVGSGTGNFSLPLARANPHLHVTLLDRPETIADARTVWAAELSDAVTAGQVAFVEGDFFKELAVPNHDVYYLRNILHNWADPQSVIILRNIRQVMGPQSRILIHEYVLQHLAGTAGVPGLSPAPAPLLPNHGAGSIRSHYLDFRMMFLLNAKERTFDAFVQLGAEAGLKVARVWDMVDTCAIEMIIA